MSENTIGFNDVIRELRESFKIYGFKGRGMTFRNHLNENIVVLNIQKSKSREKKIKFTINIGVYSSRLGKFYDSCLNGSPSIEDCHWSCRIGSIVECPDDLWFYPETKNVVNNITEILDRHFFNKMSEITNDEGLLNRWLRNKNSGVTEFDRLLNISVLSKKFKSVDINKSILELRNYASNKGLSVDYHIKRLNESS